MGFLSMMGLVTAEEHAKALKANENIIERASILVAAEEFSGVVGLPNKVALAIQRLKEARNAQFENRQRYLTAEDKLETVTTERDEAVRNYSTMSGRVSERDAEIVGLRAQIDAATEVINDLKPDAEAMRKRRANDRNRVRTSRAKKVEAPAAAKPAPKAKAAAKKGAVGK